MKPKESKEQKMKVVQLSVVLTGFVVAGLFEVAAQQSPAPDSSASRANLSTVRGCLRGERGSYILIEDGTGLVYALRGVGNKVNGQLRHQVQVTGRIRPGMIKTGINPAKAGSNPSDTLHGIDGV